MTAQVAEGRADAEVIQHQADAKAPQAGEGLLAPLVHKQKRGLGQLELQPVRAEAGLGQNLLDLGQQVVVLQLARRQIDRDPQGIAAAPAPGHHGPAGFRVRPMPQCS